MIANFLRFPRLMLTMLKSLWCRVFYQFPILPNSLGQFQAPTTFSITVTLMFHGFFSSPTRYKFLSVFSLSFIFTLWSSGTETSTRWQILFFLLIKIRSDLLTETEWSYCISTSQGILCILFSGKDPSLCIYHLLVWSDLNLLQNYQWVPLSIQSGLV